MGEAQRLVAVDLQQARVPRIHGDAALEQHTVDGNGADRPKADHSLGDRCSIDVFPRAARDDEFGHTKARAEHILHDLQRLRESLLRYVGDVEDDLALLRIHVEGRAIGETVDLGTHEAELVADASVFDLLTAAVGDHATGLAQIPREAALVHEAQMIANGALGKLDAFILQMRRDGARADRIVGVGDDLQNREKLALHIGSRTSATHTVSYQGEVSRPHDTALRARCARVEIAEPTRSLRRRRRN